MNSSGVIDDLIIGIYLKHNFLIFNFTKKKVILRFEKIRKMTDNSDASQ